MPEGKQGDSSHSRTNVDQQPANVAVLGASFGTRTGARPFRLSAQQVLVRSTKKNRHERGRQQGAGPTTGRVGGEDVTTEKHKGKVQASLEGFRELDAEK